MSLIQVARGALRWRWQALTVWVLLSAGLCVAIQFLIKPTYEASSLLRVEPMSEQLFATSAASEASYQNFMETQVHLLTSSNVLMAAASSPGLAGIPKIRTADDPELLFREMLQVKILPKSFLINVGTTSHSPTEAASVVNAVVESFLASDAEWSEGMTKNQIKNLQAYRSGLQTQVDEKQKALLDLAARGNTAIELTAGRELGQEATKTSISIEEYKRVRSQLLTAQLELAEAEAMRDYRQTQAPVEAVAEVDVEAQIAAYLRDDPELGRLYQEIDQLNTKLKKIYAMVRNRDDPAATAMIRQVALLKTKYDRLKKQKYQQWRDQGPAPAAQAPAQLQLKDAAERVATLKAAIATLERTLSHLDVSDREHNTDAVKSAIAQSDMKRLEEMRSMVDRRLEQLRFEARGLARVRRIHEARVPARPTSDKRPRFLAVAPVGVFALIAAAAMLLEVGAGRVGATSDLSRSVGVEAYAVPPLPSGRQTRGLARSRSREELVSEYVHRVDHLREGLCGGLVHGAPGRCVLVTSAIGGEGKTTLASQLAIRCANAGASTLLIDCDLRRPALGSLLQVPDGPGLADILRGDAELEDVLFHHDVFGCDFIRAGQPESNPARVLLGQRLGPLLERLRRTYDVVIVDSPPVLPVPDALTLGRFVDGAVLVTRFDYSRMRLVEQANQALLSAGIPILGVVVNGIQASSHYSTQYASYSVDRSSADPT